MREYERFGFGDRYRLVDAAALEERIRVAGAVRGLVSEDAAVIHPGRLTRGLARARGADGRPDRRRAPPSRASGRRDARGARRW